MLVWNGQWKQSCRRTQAALYCSSLNFSHEFFLIKQQCPTWNVEQHLTTVSFLVCGHRDENVLRKRFISADERGSELWEIYDGIQIKVIRYFANTKHPDIVWKQLLKHSRGRWSTPEASGVLDLPQLEALVTQGHQNVSLHKRTLLVALTWWQVIGSGPAAATPSSPASSQSCTLKSRLRLSGRSYPVFVSTWMEQRWRLAEIRVCFPTTCIPL